MNKGLSLCAALGIGSGAMYLLDPDRGKRRRALLRDKIVWATRKTGEGIETTAHDFSNRARGLAASVQSRFRADEVSNATLVERVRAKIGRVVSHPRAIGMSADNGVVTLTGPILEDEVSSLLTCLVWVPGVDQVRNQLEVHKEAGEHPALQGGRERPGNRFEFLQENWSPATRFVAGAAGASLAVYGSARRDTLGAALGAVGLLLVAQGIINKELIPMVGGNGREANGDGI
ncbi:MAG TPA: BON domain-containing protein [Pyrinomonadaceae bacterium]|nr:BON domain-containing protein [Pyrinomonadaceae bacterium]